MSVPDNFFRERYKQLHIPSHYDVISKGLFITCFVANDNMKYNLSKITELMMAKLTQTYGQRR